MTKRRRLFLDLERLEDRTCPSLTIQQTPSLLLISGTPTVASAPLSITGSPNSDTFSITEGTTNLGTFQVGGSLQVNLASRPNDLNLNLNGGYIPNNVTLSLGAGYIGASTFLAGVNIYSATPGGAIRGSLSILGGNGQENLYLGGISTIMTPGVTRSPVAVLGSVTAATNENVNGFGNLLDILSGTRVGANVQTTNVDTVEVGEITNQAVSPATIGGNLSAGDSGSHHSMDVDITGVVNGTVSVNASGFTPGFNEFTLEQQAAGVGGVIGNTLSVSLGNSAGGNAFSFTAGSTVSGNTTLTNGSAATGASATTIDLEGTFNGSVSLNLGIGDNLVTSDTGVVGGNLSITGGNGAETISGLVGTAFDATVAGSVTINLGNGTNSATFGARASRVV